MGLKASEAQETFRMFPIGRVRKTKDGNSLEIDEPFRPGLRHLGHFSHVLVLWWAHRRDDQKHRQRLQTRPPYARDKLTGVFSCRAEYRPNPIMVTVCRIHEVDEDKGLVRIGEIDASEGTRIVDLKAYFPVCDRVRVAAIPGWLSGWPEWLPEEGIGE